jgi:hypothetical protein
VSRWKSSPYCKKRQHNFDILGKSKFTTDDPTLIHRSFRERDFLLVLLALLIFAFGLLVWGLGFYQDDWPHVYYGRTLGLSQLIDLYRYTTRPPGALLYMSAFAALGYKPLYWHLLILGIRFLTTLFFWLALRGIWPQHRRFAIWATLLFAIYPLFRLQPLSVTYFYHWTGYLLFMVSLWAMVQAVRQPARFLYFSLLSIVTSLAHMFLLEYFLGLELIRPIILWVMLAEKREPVRTRMLQLMKLWAPYLLGLVVFLLYRILLVPGMQPGAEKNPPVLLYEIFASPLSGLIKLLQAILQDVTFALTTTWSTVFNPAIFAIDKPANTLMLLVGISGGIALFFYLNRQNERYAENDVADKSWITDVLLVGLAFTLLGLAPSWVTTRSISQESSIWSQRFGLAAIAGASLVIAGLLDLLIRNLKQRTVIFTILVTLSAIANIQFTNEFRWSWTKQLRFYNQLYWRAPYIQEGTAILSHEEVFPFMGDYAVSFALGILYPKADQTKNMAYWFYSVMADFFEERSSLVEGRALANGRYLNTFKGDSLDSLVIYYAPELNQCLWVLRPEDAELRILPQVLQDIAPASDLSRIQQESPRAYAFPTDVFGKELEENWCYYFQKADLARQFGEWETIPRLWMAAESVGYQPQNGVEYLPFIEGFARQGDWERAITMSQQANRITRAMPKILCPTWERIAAEMEPSEGQSEALRNLQVQLRCDG